MPKLQDSISFLPLLRSFLHGSHDDDVVEIKKFPKRLQIGRPICFRKIERPSPYTASQRTCNPVKRTYKFRALSLYLSMTSMQACILHCTHTQSTTLRTHAVFSLILYTAHVCMYKQLFEQNLNYFLLNYLYNL